MTVKVSFLTPAGIGSVAAPGVGSIRITETVALSAVTVAAAGEGEVVLVYNGETSAIMVAHGSAPDAAAVAQTPVTSAGLAVPAGQMSQPIVLSEFSKISVKALA